MGPFAPLTVVAAGGCLKPDGGRFEPREGEGEDCEDLAPLMVVCTEGRGGRFNFCCGRADLAGMTAAIDSEGRKTTEEEPPLRLGCSDTQLYAPRVGVLILARLDLLRFDMWGERVTGSSRRLRIGMQKSR